MILKCVARIDPKLLDNPITNDDILYHHLAIKLISDMPFNELKKIIEFKKTDHDKGVFLNGDTLYIAQVTLKG